MSNKSVYEAYEDATRRYYGADRDPFKLVPVVSDKEVAHGIALQADKRLGSITEDELTKSALLMQSRNRYTRGVTDLSALQEQALQDKLNMVVVNAEITHAHELPQDFREDAMESGAYQMGNGVVMAPPPTPDELRQ